MLSPLFDTVGRVRMISDTYCLALMIAGGLVEAICVKAERQAVEDIATPLTVEDTTEPESHASAER